MTTQRTTPYKRGPYKRGDVFLIGFLFADETGAKRRPALIVSSNTYHAARYDVIIAAITGNTSRRRLVGDEQVVAWEQAGLLKPSVVTAILRTVKADMLQKRLGVLAPDDLARVDAALETALDL